MRGSSRVHAPPKQRRLGTCCRTARPNGYRAELKLPNRLSVSLATASSSGPKERKWTRKPIYLFLTSEDPLAWLYHKPVTGSHLQSDSQLHHSIHTPYLPSPPAPRYFQQCSCSLIFRCTECCGTNCNVSSMHVIGTDAKFESQERKALKRV